MQPLGGFLGDINEPPYMRLSGDDRFGSGSGETMYINLDHRDDFRRMLVFVYIYDQTAGVRPYARGGDAVSEQRAADRDRPGREASAGTVVCGGADRERQGEITVRREVKFVYGFQAELDRLYGWGLQWGRGYKTKAER